eukprot:776446-Pyramimonas_sp.AAC.1
MAEDMERGSGRRRAQVRSSVRPPLRPLPPTRHPLAMIRSAPLFPCSAPLPPRPAVYDGALYGTWVSPRNPCVAHGARSWESWVFATLVTPAFWTFVPLVYCTTWLLPL